MKKTLIIITVAVLLIAVAAISFMTLNPKNETKMETPKEKVVMLQTTLGNITLKLYNETPLHRDNFVKLVESGFYNGLLFHRVISDFMIQGGDPESKNAPAGARLGSGSPGYTIPAEIMPQFKHKKGALAAARTNNPQRASSGSQFYIVQNNDGTPFLDEQYTVFGETIEGFDVIDKIACVQKDAADRPEVDVKIIKASIVKK
jgi:cyclophilin family peptidyl-prolyl cis-trans isomerase